MGASIPLLTVHGTFDLIDFATAVGYPLVGEVFRVERLARNQLLLAGLGAVAVHALLVAVQQAGYGVLVMYVGRYHHVHCRG